MPIGVADAVDDDTDGDGFFFLVRGVSLIVIRPASANSERKNTDCPAAHLASWSVVVSGSGLARGGSRANPAPTRRFRRCPSWPYLAGGPTGVLWLRRKSWLRTSLPPSAVLSEEALWALLSLPGQAVHLLGSSETA